MIVEELDQAQRNRNRELPAEPLFLAFRNGPVGGVVAREAAAAAEVEPAQTDEAGVDGLRRQRCREGTDAGGQGEAGEHVSHEHSLSPIGPFKLANAVPQCTVTGVTPPRIAPLPSFPGRPSW